MSGQFVIALKGWECVRSYRFLELTLDDDGILMIRLNRPEQLNAVNGEMHTELAAVFEDVETSADVRVSILTGAGRGFCAGGDFGPGFDIDQFSAEVFGKHPSRGPVTKIVRDLIWMTKPIISAVNGPAVGLGATLALLCDIVYMAEGARIGDRHVNMGVTAGDGGAVIWPLLVGVNRAKELLMTGRLLEAEEALRIGLVNHITTPEQLLPEAQAMARTLAALPPLAVQTTKAVVSRPLMMLFDAAIESSAELEARCFHTQDALEAAQAFREKRQPHYTGR